MLYAFCLNCASLSCRPPVRSLPSRPPGAGHGSRNLTPSCDQTGISRRHSHRPVSDFSISVFSVSAFPPWSVVSGPWSVVPLALSQFQLFRMPSRSLTLDSRLWTQDSFESPAGPKCGDPRHPLRGQKRTTHDPHSPSSNLRFDPFQNTALPFGGQINLPNLVRQSNASFQSCEGMILLSK